jgi:cytochrome c
MNSFELNKILGAVLFTCLSLLALNIGASAVFAPVTPAKPGFAIAVKEHASDEKAAAKEPSKPIAVLLASASVDKGKIAAKKCEACHTLTKDGPNKVGPNLWGIVGRKIAAHAGFDYSSAMKGKGGEWTF